MHDYLPKSGLIAIGLTSGLSSIACSVLMVGDRTRVVHSEVMAGPRKRRGVPHQRCYRAHRLIFDVIFERWPPGVIALGPPSEKDEPIEWVIFMRSAMFELGKSLNVPVQLYDHESSILRTLNRPDERSGLKTLIKRQLPEFRSNKRRIILSTATAMAGARQVLPVHE